jgi:hypothetical protein
MDKRIISQHKALLSVYRRKANFVMEKLVERKVWKDLQHIVQGALKRSSGITLSTPSGSK